MTRIGIVGATGHTGYVTEGVRGRPDLEVVGVAPGSEGESIDGLLAELRRQGEDPTRYDDHAALLDRAAPDVVAVAPYFGDIATVTVDVLEQDSHAFAEKPLATTLDDLAAVRDAHARSDGDLAAMFGLRYEPAFRTAHERVTRGAVGDVRLLNARKSYKLGERETPYRDRETYGGTIPWVGIHAVDWIDWLTPEPFRSVRASHTTTGNRGHGDLEATALVDFELADDVFASVSVDYLRPATAPTHGDDFLRIVGTEGVLVVRRDRAYLIDDDADGERELPLVAGTNSFEDFVDAAGDGLESSVSATDSIEATEAALLARRAADEDRRIEF